MIITIIILSLIPLLFLIAGVILMASGNLKLNEQYSNRLMALRVGFQAVAIIFLAVIYYFAQH